MTLSSRNIFFKTGIIFTSLCFLVFLAASITVLPVYPAMEMEIARRSGGFFQALTGHIFNANLYAVHVSMAVSVLYAFLTMILIYYFFEKTQSPEILFIAFFTVSFSFEEIRLILPLGRMYDIPSLYLLMIFRILLFGRYFGIFSLFAASVYAAGLEVQKQRNILLVISVATMVIALGVPIDTQTWDSSLNMINGYLSMFRLIEAGTFLITVISFLIAAWSRGSREFVFISAGTALAFLGRNMLLCADTWAGPILGVLLLATGTWFICTKLHKVYLWL
ncbi:MAG: hypothetical protein LBD18_02375 [Treponema sp.]|nr:hypothetical protein [Treponema sp.]